jgi:hypothetical protein
MQNFKNCLVLIWRISRAYFPATSVSLPRCVVECDGGLRFNRERVQVKRLSLSVCEWSAAAISAVAACCTVESVCAASERERRQKKSGRVYLC